MTKTKAKPPTIDLGTLDTHAACETGAEFELVHPASGAGLGIYITVQGKHAEVFTAFAREAQRKAIRRATSGKTRTEDQILGDIASAEKEAIKLLAEATLSWRSQAEDGSSVPTLTFNGEELECTAENARKVYAARPWIKDQVDAAAGDLGNFMPA